MFERSLFVLFFAVCVTMVLSKPGYGIAVDTKPKVSSSFGDGLQQIDGHGDLHGQEGIKHDAGDHHESSHPEPEPEPKPEPKPSFYGGGRGGSDDRRSTGGHDRHSHSPGAYDNDRHNDRSGEYDNDRHSGRSGGHDNDSQRRSGGYDNHRHSRGYDNDRHAAGAFDNDNQRKSGRYDSDRDDHRHGPGAYDNDNHRRQESRDRDTDRHRQSHESSEEGHHRGSSGYHGGVTPGSSYIANGPGKHDSPRKVGY